MVRVGDLNPGLLIPDKRHYRLPYTPDNRSIIMSISLSVRGKTQYHRQIIIVYSAVPRAGINRPLISALSSTSSFTFRSVPPA